GAVWPPVFPGSCFAAVVVVAPAVNQRLHSRLSQPAALVNEERKYALNAFSSLASVLRMLMSFPCAACPAPSVLDSARKGFRATPISAVPSGRSPRATAPTTIVKALRRFGQQPPALPSVLFIALRTS